MTNPGRKDYAKDINLSWHKTTDSVLETARLCAEADKTLVSGEKSKLFKSLDFNKATFSKLVKIGSQQHLQAANVKRLLPPNYTVVYEIAKLSEQDVHAAIADGIINTNMTRSDLEAWIAERRSGDLEQKSEPDRVIATIRVPANFDEDKEGALHVALEKLKSDFGIAVQRPRDVGLDALNRVARKVDDHIRKGARLYIRSLKSTRLGSDRHLTPTLRKKRWDFKDEEVEISDDATWERVQEVLDKVGAADQFERLRDEALRLHGVSEATVKEHPPVNHEEAMKELKEAVEQFYAMHPNKQAKKYTAADFSDFH
ncbi:MAG TPA: hypothetical protein VIE65_18670 [Methylobacter sp.]